LRSYIDEDSAKKCLFEIASLAKSKHTEENTRILTTKSLSTPHDEIGWQVNQRDGHDMVLSKPEEIIIYYLINNSGKIWSRIDSRAVRERW
jgi:hypothetical protein